MAKRDSYEDDDDFLDEEIADWDEDEDLEGEAEADDDAAEKADAGDEDDDDEKGEAAVADTDLDDEDEDDAQEDKAHVEAEEPIVEEEIIYPPDDEKALAALKKLRVRLDVNEKGNVWRAIFDDTNGKDPSLVLLKGLPALKELWLLGTKVTAKGAETFKEEHPKVRVYS